MPRPSDPRKLAVWWERFERFSKAGLAVGPFCTREGVSTASFYHWRKKLRLNGWAQSATERHSGPRSGPTDRDTRLRTGGAEGRGWFQQVAVIPGTSPVPPTAAATRLPAGMVGIQLPCGTRIELSAEDGGALRAVIAEVVRTDRGLDAVMPVFGGQVVRAGYGRGVGTASC